MRSGNSILILAHIFNGNFQEALLERPVPKLIPHNESSELERISKVIQSPHKNHITWLVYFSCFLFVIHFLCVQCPEGSFWS